MNINYLVFQIIVSLLIFGIIFILGYALKDRIIHKVNFFLNPNDYLPDEQIKTIIAAGPRGEYADILVLNSKFTITI